MGYVVEVEFVQRPVKHNPQLDQSPSPSLT
jgi:hypothetical protein